MRDIHVLNTKIEDWQKFIDFLQESKYSYSIDGTIHVLPEDISDVFTDVNIRPLLTLKVGGVNIKCHFFTSDEIELDFDPREVSDEYKAKTVFEFMKAVGSALGLPVRMTPENLEERPIFEYSPETGNITYYPCELNT
jgi:hypothetical protein